MRTLRWHRPRRVSTARRPPPNVIEVSSDRLTGNSDVTPDQVQHVTAELYCERMAFQLGSNPALEALYRLSSWIRFPHCSTSWD